MLQPLEHRPESSPLRADFLGLRICLETAANQEKLTEIEQMLDDDAAAQDDHEAAEADDSETDSVGAALGSAPTALVGPAHRHALLAGTHCGD